MDTTTLAEAARKKIAAARAELCARMIERDDEVNALLVAMVAGEHCLFVGPPGCLAGDTLIQINRAGNGRTMRIDHLVQRLAGKWTAGGPAWDLTIPTMVARADRGRVRLCVLKNAWESGTKETFMLRTVGGRVIRATAEHPFLTDDGVFVRLGDLRPGYGLQVDAGQSNAGRKPKVRYRSRHTKYHPHQRAAKGGYRHYEHKLAAEAEMNGLSLEDFIGILRNDPTRAATMTYLPVGAVVHHKNTDPFDNRPGNLAVLDSQAVHALEHADENTDNVLARIATDRVFSIERFGEEPTFDIEVEDDPHCFMANGFAVHNTGKSMLCDAGAELLHGARFSYLLTKFTSPEEVFGPISLKGLQEDKYVRITAGKLPEADVAFLDEIFKASSAILNSMLKILNERTYDAGTGPKDCPLQVCVAASNEWPGGEGGQELGALFDRFLIRRTVRPIGTAAGRNRLRFGDRSEPAPLSVSLTRDELAAARCEAAKMKWSAEAKAAYEQIVNELNREGIFPGDRREYKAVGVVQAVAWIDGAARVTTDHLDILGDVLWDAPEEQPVKCQTIVAKVSNPAGFAVNNLIVEAEQVMSGVNPADLGAVSGAATKLSEICRKLKPIPGKKAENAYALVAGRLKALKAAAVDAV